MNSTTVIAVLVAAMMLGGTAYIIVNLSESEDPVPTVSVLAMVNAEGSGIFCTDSTLDIDVRDGWGGKNFMTPGPGSIQHEMLKAKAQEFSYKFMSGTGTAPDTIYWTQVAPANMSATFGDTGFNFDGGITWEPWFTQITSKYSAGNAPSNGGKIAHKIATTGMIEPGHPCCMIVAANSFIEGNDELTTRFLLAYMEAVDWVNDAIKVVNGMVIYGPNYSALEKLAWEKAFGGSGSPSNQADRDMIRDALINIKYEYEIDHDIVNSGLREYTVKLIDRFYNSGSINKRLNDPTAFANKLINYDHLQKAIANPGGFTGAIGTSQIGPSVRIAVLDSDLHQIAVRAAMDPGLIYSSGSVFDAYGVNIDLKALQPNGPAVMNLFAMGEIDIGVLGLPPVVARTANGL